MKKIKIFIFSLILILVCVFTCNFKVSASGLLDTEFKGQISYNINLSNYYYAYVFPFSNQNQKFLSISDNNGFNIDIITYYNDRLYYAGSSIDATHASNYIYSFLIDVANLGNNNYRFVMYMYRLYINENIGSWEAVEIAGSYVLNIDFNTNYIDNIFLLLNNNIIYIGAYNGALQGVTTVSSIFNNYLLSSSNSLGKYITHLENNAYNIGFAEGIQPVENIPLAFITPILSFFTTFFAIELAPGLTIGYLVLIPLIMGVIGLILYFWRKD